MGGGVGCVIIRRRGEGDLASGNDVLLRGRLAFSSVLEEGEEPGGGSGVVQNHASLKVKDQSCWGKF